MASFLTEVKRPVMPESAKKLSEENEIAAMVKARGFERGTYTFYPNPNIQRKEGSIINGSIKGYFTLNEYSEDIVLDRETLGLNEKTWRRICSAFGYKYHVPTDIDRFVISPKSVRVEISLTTPPTED